MKNGQVTIFILIAILIIAGISSIFIFRDSLSFANIPKGSDAVYNSFFYCLEQTGEIATLIVLIQGGTYEEGNFSSLKIYKLAKPISKEDDEKAINISEKYKFTKENLENSIEIFIKNSLNYCIDSIDFTRLDQEVIFDEFDINVDVTNKFITMNLNFPIIINKENTSLYLERFTYRKKIDIGTMEEVVNQIVNESVESNFPPYESMNKLKEKHNINMSVVLLKDENSTENMLYLIQFKEENNVEFVIQYDWY